MFYRDILPNFRINDGIIEIPHEFDHMLGPLPAEDLEKIKKLAMPVIRELTRAHKPALIFDESSEDHRSTVWGTLVPLDAWNRTGEKPVPGWYFET